MKPTTRALLTAAFSVALSTPLQGEQLEAIEGVRFSPIEAHDGDIANIEMIEEKALGEMPVPIVEDDGGSFIKVLLPDGSHAWLNRADVQIGSANMEAVCSNARQYTQSSGSRSAHLRGISRDCQ